MSYPAFEKYFTKDGNVDFDCKATKGATNIGAEALVTIPASEAGKEYFVSFEIKKPNGTYVYPVSEHVFVTAGTNTFSTANNDPKMDALLDQIGDYIITDATAYWVGE